MPPGDERLPGLVHAGRAQALSVDQSQLRDLIGDTELRDLLDEAVLDTLEQELQHLPVRFHTRSTDAVHDLLLRLGDLSRAEIETRQGWTVGAANAAYYARIVRGETKALAARPHVEAARLAKVGRIRILTRHLLPGVVPTAVITASLDIGNVVLLLAALSFLGLGQQAPAPELGADTARALSQLLSQWWVPGIPGLAVLLLTLIANLGGDAIRSLIPVRR